MIKVTSLINYRNALFVMSQRDLIFLPARCWLSVIYLHIVHTLVRSNKAFVLTGSYINLRAANTGLNMQFFSVNTHILL